MYTQYQGCIARYACVLYSILRSYDTQFTRGDVYFVAGSYGATRIPWKGTLLRFLI